MIWIASAINMTILTWKSICYDSTDAFISFWGSKAVGFLLVINIGVFNGIWGIIAQKLNDWED
jgi:hypothetical protein